MKQPIDAKLWIITKIKAEYTNLMWGNNKTMTAKQRGTLGPVGLKREKTNYTDLPLQWGKLTLNWKTATLFNRTEKLHKITYKTTCREILFAVNGCIFWFLKLAALIFPLLPVFKDRYSLPCVYSLSLKKRSCISSKRWLFYMWFCVVSLSCWIMLLFSSSM